MTREVANEATAGLLDGGPVPRPSERRAVRLLQVNNVPIVGCLLIGRDAPPGRYGYGYGYSYYRYSTYYDQHEEEA